MPTPYIKKLAKEGKGSVEKLEKTWHEAKAIADKDNHGEDYGYITAIFKKMIGESLTLKEFINEKMDFDSTNNTE